MNEACRTFYDDKNASAHFGDFSDPYSWYCQTSLRTHSSFNSKISSLRVWVGQKTALLLPDDIKEFYSIGVILAGSDAAFDYYHRSTGKFPAEASSIRGLTSIAVVDETCGAACGYLGSKGIEIQKDYFLRQVLAEARLQKVDQTIFYEMGRNFWFYEDKLEIPNTNGVVATGYAVGMRVSAIDEVGLKPAPFSASETYTALRSRILALEQILFDRRNNLNWSNTLAIGKGIPESNLGGTDLFASKLLKLKKECGGQGFIERFFRWVDKLPSTNQSKDNAGANFLVAASLAAETNLISVLAKRWGYPNQVINQANDSYQKMAENSFIPRCGTENFIL